MYFILTHTLAAVKGSQTPGSASGVVETGLLPPARVAFPTAASRARLPGSHSTRARAVVSWASRARTEGTMFILYVWLPERITLYPHGHVSGRAWPEGLAKAVPEPHSPSHQKGRTT